MAIPANVEDLINRRVVELTRIEFRGDWNPTPIIAASHERGEQPYLFPKRRDLSGAVRQELWRPARLDENARG